MSLKYEPLNTSLKYEQVAASGGAEALVGGMQRWMDGRLGEQRESTVEQVSSYTSKLGDV